MASRAEVKEFDLCTNVTANQLSPELNVECFSSFSYLASFGASYKEDNSSSFDNIVDVGLYVELIVL